MLSKTTPQFIIIAVAAAVYYRFTKTPQDENRPIMGFALIIHRHHQHPTTSHIHLARKTAMQEIEI